MIATRNERGFTLLEVVLTIAIMAVLMGGLTSAVLIATHAAPEEDSVYAHQLEGERVAQAILSELQTALWVMEQTATSITFTIPDRGGDGLPERIRYNWTSNRLDRTYNGTTATVLTDVTSFDLSYREGSIAETYKGPLEILKERLVSRAFHDKNTSEVALGSETLLAELFDPNLDGAFDPNVPEADRTWRPTRVRLRLRSDGLATGVAEVSLTGSRMSVPQTKYLTSTVNEAALSSTTAWHEVPFSQTVDLAPDATYAITLNATGSSKDTAMQVQFANVADSTGRFLVGDAGGWTTSTTSKQMLHFHMWIVSR